MDIKNLMEMAEKLRGQLTQAHNDAAERRFTGEAGAGMVRVVINGRHEVMEVKIDKTAVDPEDLTMLEDLIRAAFNQAAGQLVGGLRDQVSNLAQGMGIDPSAFVPPGGEGGDDSDSGEGPGGGP